MSAKDQSTLTSKLKQFFRGSKTGAGLRERNDFTITSEIEKELRPETPVAQRCKALKDLGEDVLTKRLEEYAVQRLWDLTKDLIVPNKPAEQRQIALSFYRKLIQGQYDNLHLMRAHFFRVIRDHEVLEDLQHRLEMLKSLTENGKDIQYFEKDIGKFMLHWVQPIEEAGIIVPFLDLLVNIIKYNAAYLEKDVVVGIVQNVCYFSCSVDDSNTVIQCLSVLDAVICYAIFPNETLTLCIIALCRTVNKEAYCQASWKIMRNLLGTSLGHASLLTMCNILNDKMLYRDEALLRGAVFHTNMGLWGWSGSIVPMLKCSPSTVLTSFWHALKSEHIIVTYEVALSIQRLIQKSGNELSEPAWDVICDIMFEISTNIGKSGLPKDNIVVKQFHETLDLIEQMLQKDAINADPEKIYSLIEKVSAERPESSVINLIDYMSSRISATRPQWLQALCSFMDRFYKMKNTNIRVYSIQALIQIMTLNRAAYEEEILERIVMVHLVNIPHETDLAVRTAVAKLLIDFTLHCDTKRCMELLEIIEKMLNRPFDNYLQDGTVVKSENDIEDVIVLVEGLIKIFVVKLYHLPSLHAIKVYHLLISHLESHYNRPVVFQNVNKIRFHIFRWMMKARANASFHIGYPDPLANDAIKFSHYLGIEGPYQHQSQQPQPYIMHPKQQENQQQPIQHQTNLEKLVQSDAKQQPAETIPAANLTTISIKRGCQAIVKCLEIEKDWQVIQQILTELPNIMQNKALIQGNDVDSLARTLFKVYTDKSLVETFIIPQNTVRPTTSDFHSLVLPALASLATYHQHLDPTTQKKIIEALKTGFISRKPRICVQTLTLLLLEMPDTLVRQLPELLLELSKMTTSVTVAIPVLEFLSTLSRLPNHRFAHFITVQYMYVFAMSLPYTNPFRYDHYTVSLAHHVVAGWFLKCRLPLRRNLVNYIIQGLESNVHVPFQEITKSRNDFSQANEDSSNRKRSSSLTEQGSRRRERASLQQHQRPAKSDLKPQADSDVYAFHRELGETCLDFMARHTYSPCSALPKRIPAADFLLAGGQTTTWHVGHNLITITTSGCSSSTFRNGLCDRCFTMCKSSTHLLLSKSESTNSTGTILSPESSIASMQKEHNAVADLQNKRYTKASLQHSSANESDSTDLTTSSTSSSIAATPFSQPQNHNTRFFRQNSQEGRFSNSSGSLEALSRRGSNPDAPENVADQQHLNKSESALITTLDNKLARPEISNLTPVALHDRPVQLCACSCTGWAEICIRRPTGTISWIMKIQNQITYDSFTNDFPLQDLTTLFLPTLGGGIVGHEFMNKHAHNSTSDVSVKQFEIEHHQPPNSAPPKAKVSISDEVFEIKKEDREEDDESEHEDVPEIVNTILAMSSRNIQAPTPILSSGTSGPIDIPGNILKRKDSDEDQEVNAEENPDVPFNDTEGRSRNPVRRVNSSPEMSSNWKNQFMNHKNSKEAAINTGGGGGGGGGIATSDSHEEKDVESQQKKKNYGKDMRVSCEAIPEEIAGSTPPSVPKSGIVEVNNLTVRASGTIKQQTEFSTKSAGAVLIPSASLPEPASSDNTGVVPRKQHSADEALISSATIPEASVVETPTPQPIPISQTLSSSSLNLKLPMEMQKVTSKPPHSPAPLSPRLLARNVSNAKLSNSGNASPSFPLNHNDNDLPRGRSKTISVAREHYSIMSSMKWNLNKNTSNTSRLRGEQGGAASRSVISPSFVFLQLYNTGQLNISEKPLKVDPMHEKAIALLDLIPPFETHKIGVLYVGPGQANNETEILKNRFGSLRYAEFLRNLGTLVAIKDAKEHNFFINMESNGRDGNFTYIWQDDIVQVTFHVATLMPNKEQDPNCNEKKKHIGNDFVTIVYNESGEEYNLNTIKGQFNYACVIVQPLELNTNRVFVRAKDEIAEHVCHSEPKLVSDSSAPLLARQLALHANLASLVSQSLRTRNQSPYASNWLERLRKIKLLRTKLLSESNNQDHGTSSGPGTPGSGSGSAHDLSSPRSSYMDDFTVYT